MFAEQARARLSSGRMPPLVRVGHKGADLIEPGNTRASFDAALAHGVDMIELDVLPERGGGELILAHDYEDAAERSPLTLEEGLAYLAGEAFVAVDLIVDLPELEAVSPSGAGRARRPPS
jgi:glycerophosphoryl diester phosphodiesterase